MKAVFLLVFLSILSFFAEAQSIFVPPNLAMPAQQNYVKRSTIPGPRYGFNTDRLGPTGCVTTTDGANCGGSNHVGYSDNDQGGAFRVTCGIAEFTFSDPIVKPNQDGASHGHVFFGRTGVNAQTPPSNFRTPGARSTCNGGTLNLSGYWIPWWQYSCPVGEVGCINHGVTGSRDGEVLPPRVITTYYKVLYSWDRAHLGLQRWAPPGLRMVAGNPSNRVPGMLPGTFNCSSGPSGFTHIPSAREVASVTCDEITTTVVFQNCWDGVNLYLPPLMSDPTHSAHVSGTVGSACPSAFPYGLPNVSYNAVTQFTKSDLDYIILSSDPLPEYGSLDTGSTTTTVVLSASASSVTDYYKYGYVAFASLNQRRQITAYNGATRTATLDLALPSAPGVGVGYLVRQHGGITSHGDWVNGWDQTNNNLLGFGGNITDYILSGCYGIADPARWGADNTSTNRSGDCHDNNVGALNRLHQPFSRTENATYYWVY